jgi:uncharacterized protein (DUF433 family)
MSDEALLQRITLNPAVLAGKPVIAGTRLSVEFIVNLLATARRSRKFWQIIRD